MSAQRKWSGYFLRLHTTRFVTRYTIKVIRSILANWLQSQRMLLCNLRLTLFFFTKLSTSWDLSENLLITKLTFKVSARRLLWIPIRVWALYLINIWQMFNLATEDLHVKPYIPHKSWESENIGIVIFDLRGHGGC